MVRASVLFRVQTAPDQDSAGRAPAWLAALVLSLLLVGASVALTELLQPAEADGLPLRWLRLFASHPVRSLLAVALILWSLHPRHRKPVLSR